MCVDGHCIEGHNKGQGEGLKLWCGNADLREETYSETL